MAQGIFCLSVSKSPAISAPACRCTAAYERHWIVQKQFNVSINCRQASLEGYRGAYAKAGGRSGPMMLAHTTGGGENVVGVVEWTTKGTSTDYSIIVKLPFLVTIVFENAAHITGSWPLRSGEICPKLHLPVHTVCDIGALLSRLQSFSSYLVKLSSIDCLPRPLALVSTCTVCRTALQDTFPTSVWGGGCKVLVLVLVLVLGDTLYQILTYSTTYELT
jgi:hypothetical protein